MKSDLILVMGTTGYLGRQLITALFAAGYRVRAMGRIQGKTRRRPRAGHSRVELAQEDVLDLESLKRETFGCRVAYYLAHSMIPQNERFVEARAPCGPQHGRSGSRCWSNGSR